ncbi:MAG: hypothetical protein K2J48_08410 [Muribaculaceae bacterium]|nr:hypothetical protein [Muribaculaceae bacterium]
MVKNYLTLWMMLLAVVLGIGTAKAEGLTVELSSSWGSNIVRLDKDVKFRAQANQEADLRITVNDTEIVNQKNVAANTKVEGVFTFSTTGDFTVTAYATANGETVSSTAFYCVPTASQPASSQTVPPMGAFRNADGTVTFCFAAPEKETVILVGSWNDYKVSQAAVMDYVDGPADGEGSFRYFTKTVSGVPVNEPVLYYYMVNNGTSYKNVGDPYARLVLDPNNDKWISPEVYPDMPAYPEDKVKNVCLAVFQDNFGEYEWKVKDFKGAPKDDLVIYELLFRDFTGTEGKALGDGTVRKAIGKIPYLKSLGINAVELLPINEFDGNLSWGYNPNFYFAIDKAYGTAQDYKEFIDICHENGIAVILDVVFNQSAGLHPWYQLYAVGSNPFYNKEAPHAYSVLNDWKQEYPLVQQQWHDMLKYWLTEYKVDGFRFDLVKGLGDNSSYAGSGSLDSRTNRFNQSRVNRMKRLHDAMREVNPDAYFINELLGDAKEENEMATDGELNWFNNNYNGCEFAMGWKSNLNTMWAPKASRSVGSTVSYLESHDEERLAYKQDMYGVEGIIKGNRENSCFRLAGAAVQMLMVPGSHMIWQFSEMGNAQSTKKGSDNDTGNKIVNWALMDNPANGGLVDRYRELIHIRLANPELFGPDADYSLNFNSPYNYPSSTPKNLLYATSFYGNKELYVLINSSVNTQLTSTVAFRSDNASDYQILSNWGATDPVIDYANKTVTLPANGYVVIANKSVESSVGSVVGDSADWGVYCNGGSLYVVNASSPVDVWNAAGMKVAHGEGNFNVSLPSGLYIVNCGGKSVKVRL